VASPPETAPGKLTAIERILRRDQLTVMGMIILITLLCWAWIVPMARDMYGAMTGPAAWMMTTTWDTTHLLLLLAMWAVMMAGMMLPSASPLLLFYAGALRRRADGDPTGARVYAMASGYLLVWAGFSVAATLLQRWLSELLLLNPMMEPASTPVTAALLIVAGMYQLTPLKRMCLRSCRSPLSFVMRRWQNGVAGALRMGVEHGMHCLGCCWALMLLLFAGGVMNIYVIVALTILVLIEKVTPFGEWTSRLSGVAFLALAAWLLLR